MQQNMGITKKSSDIATLKTIFPTQTENGFLCLLGVAKDTTPISSWKGKGAKTNTVHTPVAISAQIAIIAIGLCFDKTLKGSTRSRY